MIRSRKLTFLTFFLLVSTIYFDTVLPQQEIPWWNDKWSYREEIIPPIDTTDSHAQFQPIDIRITPNNRCWIKNETIYSVRICCWDGQEWYELESQLYDIEHKSENLAEAFSLVFLIPDIADGNEKYYVYYDEEETPIPEYPDHVELTKDHYYYEPIPGQKADFDYFKITDEDYCIYGVGISGMMMTEYASQMIFRQSKGQKEFGYSYWDRLAAFCFQYKDTTQPKGQETITTRMEEIFSKIYDDGNIMLRFGIESTTSRNDAKTTNFYKYYHSPSDVKRICANVKHETLKDIEVAEDVKLDGEYGFITGFKTRSEANPHLNTGEILPFIHYYDEDNTIQEIPADTDPKNREEEFLISVEDNGDLGEIPWISVDESESGKGHALIFSSNSVLKSGTDEQDGIQLKANQKQEVDMPGLKAYSSGVGCFRNSYTSDSIDFSIPSDLVVEFDGEFYTTETNGYQDVEKEAEFYKTLIKSRPLLGGNITGLQEEEGEKHTLTVYTHFSPSFPLGSLVSAASGKNFSYTYAELYQDGSLISSGICSRISLKGELNLEDVSLSSIINLFDWRDISLFKKIRFPKLFPGNYVVKIFIKTRGENKFVGVATVDLQENTTIHVFCKNQGTVKINLNDQDGNNVPNAQCYLLCDGEIVSKFTSGETKEMILSAPRGKYKLKIMYNGFKITEKEIKIGLIKKQENIEIVLSILELLVKDEWGLSPGIKIKPYLFSEEMEEPIKIFSEEEKPGVYHFSGLSPASYIIQISYKSYLNEKEIQIPDDKTVSMIFSPTFEFTINIFDVRGSPLKNTKINILREGKELESTTDENGITTFEIPVGAYTVKAYDDKELIAEKDIEISRDETTFLVTSKEPLFPIIMMVISVIIIISGLVLLIVKKVSFNSFLKTLGIAFIIVALVLPWWQLYGSDSISSVERITNTYLLPQNMVTATTFEGVQEYELSNIPPEFTGFILILAIIAAVSCLPIIFSILLKKRKRMSNILAILGIILLIVSCIIFSYGFYELARIGLGELQGSGELEILPYGSQDYVNIQASWGLSYGFYLCLATAALWIISIIIKRK